MARETPRTVIFDLLIRSVGNNYSHLAGEGVIRLPSRERKQDGDELVFEKHLVMFTSLGKTTAPHEHSETWPSGSGTSPQP